MRWRDLKFVAPVLPNFLYALFLLRKVRNDTLLSTDPAPLPQRG